MLQKKKIHTKNGQTEIKKYETKVKCETIQQSREREKSSGDGESRE